MLPGQHPQVFDDVRGDEVRLERFRPAEQSKAVGIYLVVLDLPNVNIFECAALQRIDCHNMVSMPEKELAQ